MLLLGWANAARAPHLPAGEAPPLKARLIFPFSDAAGTSRTHAVFWKPWRYSIPTLQVLGRYLIFVHQYAHRDAPSVRRPHDTVDTVRGEPLPEFLSSLDMAKGDSRNVRRFIGIVEHRHDLRSGRTRLWLFNRKTDLPAESVE